MNGRDLDLLDELCTPAIAPKLRTAFSTFGEAFPDWHQEALSSSPTAAPSSPG